MTLHLLPSPQPIVVYECKAFLLSYWVSERACAAQSRKAKRMSPCHGCPGAKVRYHSGPREMDTTQLRPPRDIPKSHERVLRRAMPSTVARRLGL